MALKTCTRAAGAVGAYAQIEIRLSQDTIITATSVNYLAAWIKVTAAADGSYSVQLQANADLTPANTYYTVSEYAGTSSNTYSVVVPATAGPFDLSTIQVSPPPAASALVALDAQVVHLANPETITGVKVFAAAPTFSLGANFPSGAGVVFFGAGDDVTYYVAGTPFEMDARQGTAASPITTGAGPTFKISRTEQITEASMPGGVGANNQGNAGLWVSALGNSLNEVQVNGVFASAINSSTQSAHNDDACGLNAQGSIQGSGTGYGIGAYIAGRRDTNTGNVNGLEARSGNYTATDGVYSASGPSDTMGVWATAGGSQPSAVAYVAGKSASLQTWHVGFAAVAGSVTDTTFRDDSSATNSFVSNGTHTIAFAAGATAGISTLGGTSSVFGAANGLLELQGSANNVDGLLYMGSTSSSNGYHMRVRNVSGQVSLGICNSSFITGAAVGDAFLGSRTGGKRLLIGGTTQVIQVTNGNALGFFAHAEATQQTVTGSRSANAALASLLTALAAHGLVVDSSTA